jgi:hypothetical protein
LRNNGSVTATIANAVATEISSEAARPPAVCTRAS